MRMRQQMRKNGMGFGKSQQQGFSAIEILLVVAISMVIVGIGVPVYVTVTNSMRVAGDLRNLTGVTAQAKMRAPADFTRARIYANLNGGSFQLQIWKKAGSGCWVADADTTSTCLTYSSGAPSGSVTALSQGDTFGYTTLTVGPTPGQATIGQSANCLDNSGATLANTACIVFNSRGIPINASTLAPLATGALYLTNGTVVDGLTISATGSIQTWSKNLNASNSNWIGQ
jgi:Tfp pilus assembly protein FimT